MVRFVRRVVVLILLLCAVPRLSAAGPITIDFESLSEGDAVTTQFANLTLSNATVLTAGSLLNEFENPPHSGSNVVFDDGGAISIDFTSPVSNFGGYFTYGLTSPQRLALTAFDSTHTPLGLSTLSAYSNNQGVSGDRGSSPNELLQLLFSNISFITILGDPSGGSFTADDLTYTAGSLAQQPSPVPEPATISLVLVGGTSLVAASRRRRKRSDVDK